MGRGTGSYIWYRSILRSHKASGGELLRVARFRGTLYAVVFRDCATRFCAVLPRALHRVLATIARYAAKGRSGELWGDPDEFRHAHPQDRAGVLGAVTGAERRQRQCASGPLVSDGCVLFGRTAPRDLRASC